MLVKTTRYSKPQKIVIDGILPAIHSHPFAKNEYYCHPTWMGRAFRYLVPGIVICPSLVF